MGVVVRVIFLLLMMLVIISGTYSYDGIMNYFNLDTGRGTATPVIRHYFNLFTINAYYMSLSVKDYFVNLDWGLGHGVMFLAVLFYSALDVVKRLYSYRFLVTDFQAVIKLPVVAVAYLMFSIFAPYRVTKIMDGDVRYDYEASLMSRLIGADVYSEIIQKSAVLRSLVLSDLQASYLTDLLEIAYRKKMEK